MSSPSTPDNDKVPAKASNFLRQIIENDLTHGTYSGRRWGGTPGDAGADGEGLVAGRARSTMP